MGSRAREGLRLKKCWGNKEPERRTQADAGGEFTHPSRANSTLSPRNTPLDTLNKMQGLFSTLLVVLVASMIVTSEAGKNKKEKNKGGKAGAECAEWLYGTCVANNGDCGAGTREGTCNEQVKKVKCRVPCNWKKEFGADCKYKFGNWGECDAATSTKSRVGTLQKALFNVECKPNVSVSKPCTTKVKNKPKGKKGKGKGN